VLCLYHLRTRPLDCRVKPGNDKKKQKLEFRPQRRAWPGLLDKAAHGFNY
jgi:hypothetical protein